MISNPKTPTTLTLTLPPETERKLRPCAAASGQDVTVFALKAIQEKLQTTPLSTQDDRLASLHQEFRDSGMTDDELYEFLKTARDEVRREKRQRIAMSTGTPGLARRSSESYRLTSSSMRA